MPPNSSRRRGFGVLLGSIRDQTGDKQIPFAKRLNVSRSLIANVETGEAPPSRTFIAILVRAFPDKAGEIYAAAERYRPASAIRAARDTSPELQRIDTLLAKGPLSWTDAFSTLLDLNMQSKQAVDDDQRFAVAIRLARLQSCWDARFPIKRIFVSYAIRQGSTSPDRATETQALVEQLYQLISDHPNDPLYSCSYTHDNLQRDLLLYPESAAIWRHKGILRWSEHAFAEAYACITIALRCKGPRLDLNILQGQILAEWGRYAQAISELGPCVEDPSLTPSEVARVRCWYAYALYHTGDKAQAWTEFTKSEEVVSSSGHLHYLRAVCQAQEPDLAQAALDSFKRALDCSSPELNAKQKEKATRWITEGQ